MYRTCPCDKELPTGLRKRHRQSDQSALVSLGSGFFTVGLLHSRSHLSDHPPPSSSEQTHHSPQNDLFLVFLSSSLSRAAASTPWATVFTCPEWGDSLGLVPLPPSISPHREVLYRVARVILKKRKSAQGTLTHKVHSSFPLLKLEGLAWSPTSGLSVLSSSLFQCLGRCPLLFLWTLNQPALIHPTCFMLFIWVILPHPSDCSLNITSSEGTKSCHASFYFLFPNPPHTADY